MDGLPIRVLCVFSWLDRGGAETMCMDLYRHIDRSKVQFDFVKHTNRKCAYEDEILSLGGKIYEAPQYKVYNQRLYCRWWEQHLRNHPEHQIIHGHYFTAAPIYFKICKKMKRITIGHSHCTKAKSPDKLNEKIRYYAQQIVLKKLEKRSDYCFACSNAAGAWLFKHKKFTVLRNAIDTEKFSFSPEVRRECRRELSLPEDALVVGTVGRITFPKNPEGMIEIIKSLRAHDDRTRFLWVGEMYTDVRPQLRRESLTDSVILTGARRDVERMLQGMDVFILPSRYEGFGIAALEAQSSGMPCICSEEVPQEVQVTDLCSFLPLEHPDLWAETIINIDKTRKDCRQQLKDAGYDIHTTSKWVQDFYLSLNQRSE